MNNRNAGLDILKIYAMLMVVVLHVGGFAFSLNGEAAYSLLTLVAYFAMEAVAYPAIHLFVMIGSWFMLEKVNPVKQISRIWLQTWIVTITGFIIYVFIINEKPSVWGGVSCIIPFLGRAYWFVTEYIILILLAPFLNKVIGSCTEKEHFF